jgi:hypothetical protein
VKDMPAGIRLFNHLHDGSPGFALWCPACRHIHHVPLGGDGAAVIGGITWGHYEHWRASVFHQGDTAGAARVQQLWDDDQAKRPGPGHRERPRGGTETLRRLNAQQENQRAQDELLARTRADRDRAVAAADGLRLRASTYLDAAGCGTLTGDPAIECIRKAAAAIGDALGRSGEIARRAAADADEARARGLKCEADYDALTLKASPPR